jgi:hypothetical protein
MDELVVAAVGVVFVFDFEWMNGWEGKMEQYFFQRGNFNF